MPTRDLGSVENIGLGVDGTHLVREDLVETARRFVARMEASHAAGYGEVPLEIGQPWWSAHPTLDDEYPHVIVALDDERVTTAPVDASRTADGRWPLSSMTIREFRACHTRPLAGDYLDDHGCQLCLSPMGLHHAQCPLRGTPPWYPK